MGLSSRPSLIMGFLAIGLGGWITPQRLAMAQAVPMLAVASSEMLATEVTETEVSFSTSRGATESSTELGEAEFLAIDNDNNVVTTTDDRAGASIPYQVALDEEPSSSERTEDESDLTEPEDEGQQDAIADDELGILRVRSRPVGLDNELGVLRIRPTEDVPLAVEPEPTRQTTVFLTGRSNLYGGNNLFRTQSPIDDRIYQAGIGVFAFPKLGDKTNAILSAEANIARYEDLAVVDYNEVQLQAGIRQRLGERSYSQLNWRYQDLSHPGRESFFSANYLELLLSRRDILNSHTWVDAYYQARLSMSNPDDFSRLSQIVTGSINYGFDSQTRASVIYQVFFDDYTQVSRYDTYHQIITQFSHDLSDTTRLSLFTGFRFGRSSRSSVDFDDTIYGASVNVNLPLF